MVDAIWRALRMAFAMGCEILWPLILGFALSAVVQAVISQREMVRLLPDDRPRSIATALTLGAASSSCFLCGGGDRPVADPQGRQLPGRDPGAGEGVG